MGASTPKLEKKQFVSFDGGTREVAVYQRPDRYRGIEHPFAKRFRIARGGGYSYAAASFWKNSIVQDVSLFNRVLEFDIQHGWISVEAGITLASLLSVIVPEGFWLPVIPGYPEITIGGCVAANVHGKNPAYKGTFRQCVKQIKLFHPAYGVFLASEEENPSIFQLTCGGYGLTGIILAVTLQLEKLPGVTVAVKRTKVVSLFEAYQILIQSSSTSEFAYSMHQADARSRQFGHGSVGRGIIIPDTVTHDWAIPRYRVIAPGKRTMPVSLFGGWRTLWILAAHGFLENISGEEITEPLFDMIFPFARKWYYFFLYGKPGVAEYQMIIPERDVEPFLLELQRVLLKEKPPAVMCSIKVFKGVQHLLRFEMDGACLALDLVRCPETLRFFSVLDNMLISCSGIPYLVKDSRLPQDVAKKCYPEFDMMKKQLDDYDPDRLYRSEMSTRLAL